MLSEKLKEYHIAWVRLDPSKQLMFWSACGTIVPGLLLALFAVVASHLSTHSVGVMVSVLSLGVFLFFGSFLLAVLYLTVIWPHHYKKEQKKVKKTS